MSSRPKLIYCTIANYDVIIRACDLAGLRDAKVVALKTELTQTIRGDMVDVMELAHTRGLNLSDASKFNENADPNSLCLLPNTPNQNIFNT